MGDAGFWSTVFAMVLGSAIGGACAIGGGWLGASMMIRRQRHERLAQLYQPIGDAMLYISAVATRIRDEVDAALNEVDALDEIDVGTISEHEAYFKVVWQAVDKTYTSRGVLVFDAGHAVQRVLRDIDRLEAHFSALEDLHSRWRENPSEQSNVDKIRHRVTEIHKLERSLGKALTQQSIELSHTPIEELGIKLRRSIPNRNLGSELRKAMRPWSRDRTS